MVSAVASLTALAGAAESSFAGSNVTPAIRLAVKSCAKLMRLSMTPSRANSRCCPGKPVGSMNAYSGWPICAIRSVSTRWPSDRRRGAQRARGVLERRLDLGRFAPARPELRRFDERSHDGAQVAARSPRTPPRAARPTRPAASRSRTARQASARCGARCAGCAASIVEQPLAFVHPPPAANSCAENALRARVVLVGAEQEAAVSHEADCARERASPFLNHSLDGPIDAVLQPVKTRAASRDVARALTDRSGRAFAARSASARTARSARCRPEMLREHEILLELDAAELVRDAAHRAASAPPASALARATMLHRPSSSVRARRSRAERCRRSTARSPDASRSRRAAAGNCPTHSDARRRARTAAPRRAR